MLRDVDTDWLRYVLPGLAGRAAQVAALGQALGQAGGSGAGPVEDHAAGSSSETGVRHASERAGSGSGASSSGQAGGQLQCLLPVCCAANTALYCMQPGIYSCPEHVWHC